MGPTARLACDGSKGRFAVCLSAAEGPGVSPTSSQTPAANTGVVSLKPGNLRTAFSGAPMDFLPGNVDGARLALEACLAAARAEAGPRREQAEAVKTDANALFNSACTDSDRLMLPAAATAAPENASAQNGSDIEKSDIKVTMREREKL